MESPETKPPKKLGKGMWLIAWLCLGGLSYQYFDNKVARQYNPNGVINHQDQTGSITLVQNRQGHYVLDGLINEQQVTFMLDTGATSTVVPQHIAEQIGLTRGYASQVSTANGVISVYSTQIKSLSLGALTLYDLSAQINPYMDDDTVLLGMNVLRQFKLVQQGNELTISFN